MCHGLSNRGSSFTASHHALIIPCAIWSISGRLRPDWAFRRLQLSGLITQKWSARQPNTQCEREPESFMSVCQLR